MANHRSPHHRISLQLQHGTMLLAVMLTCVAIMLTFFALSYHNRNATNGYQLRKIQEARSDLIFQIETLEMEIADLGALK